MLVDGIGEQRQPSGDDDTGLSKEAYLGIGVGVALLLLLGVIAAIFALKRKDVKRHEYKVHDHTVLPRLWFNHLLMTRYTSNLLIDNSGTYIVLAPFEL